MPFSECLVDGIPEFLRVPAISDEGGISLLSIIISKGNSILKVKVLEGGMEGGMEGILVSRGWWFYGLQLVNFHTE